MTLLAERTWKLHEAVFRAYAVVGISREVVRRATYPSEEYQWAVLVTGIVFELCPHQSLHALSLEFGVTQGAVKARVNAWRRLPWRTRHDWLELAAVGIES